MMAGMQTEIANLDTKINTKMAHTDTKIANIDTKLENMNTKLENINTRTANTDTKQKNMNTKMGKKAGGNHKRCKWHSEWRERKSTYICCWWWGEKLGRNIELPSEIVVFIKAHARESLQRIFICLQ
jgi:chromosome segregation ATPase